MTRKNKRPRLVLIQPPLPANERHKKVLPLGLGYLASYVRKELPGATVSILDGQVRNLDLDETVEEASSLGGPETFWGITYWTAQAPFAASLSRRLRERFPSSTVIHGGVHSTIYPEEALETADFAVLHEGEATLTELLRRLLEGGGASQVSGIAFRENGETVRTSPRPFIEELDSLPFPAWDLMDVERYDTPFHVVGGLRVPVIGSRGCPYNCVYCGSPFMWKRKVRWRSPENVLDEMGEIIRRYGIPQFHFWDDNLMLNRPYVEGFCEGILKRGLKVRWTGLTRASHITRNADLVPLLARSGCIGLEIGIESANPDTFREIEKQEDLKNILEVARLHKESGMTPLFTYMAFNPGETISGYYRQARFIDKIHEGQSLPDYWVHPFPFPLYVGQMCTAHPGTKLFHEAHRMGRVLAERWDDYTHHQVNFVPNSLLEDVPVRNVLRPRSLDLSLCVWALYRSFWPDFCEAVPQEERERRIEDFRKALTAYWRLADGRRTLREIAARVRDEAGVGEIEALRYCAFASLVLGQFGLIRSRNEKGPVAPVTVAEMDQIPSPFRTPSLSPSVEKMRKALGKRFWKLLGPWIEACCR